MPEVDDKTFAQMQEVGWGARAGHSVRSALLPSPPAPPAQRAPPCVVPMRPVPTQLARRGRGCLLQAACAAQPALRPSARASFCRVTTAPGISASPPGRVCAAGLLAGDEQDALLPDRQPAGGPPAGRPAVVPGGSGHGGHLQRCGPRLLQDCAPVRALQHAGERRGLAGGRASGRGGAAGLPGGLLPWMPDLRRVGAQAAGALCLRGFNVRMPLFPAPCLPCSWASLGPLRWTSCPPPPTSLGSSEWGMQLVQEGATPTAWGCGA